MLFVTDCVQDHRVVYKYDYTFLIKQNKTKQNKSIHRHIDLHKNKNITQSDNMTITSNNEPDDLSISPEKQTPTEIELLRIENEALRSAMNVMKAKVAKYHAKATKIQSVYQKSMKTTLPNYQATKLERLAKVLKLSHKSFLKMEQKNKDLLAVNRRLERKLYERHTEVSDSSDISVDDDRSGRSSVPLLRSQLPFDDECEIIFTNLPQLKYETCHFDLPPPLKHQTSISSLPST